MKTLLILALAVFVVESSPLPFFGSRSRGRSETIATVDCSNNEALQFVLQSKENFRCVYPNSNSPSAYRSSDRDSVFPSSLGRVTAEENEECGPGFMYSVDVDMCLPAQRPSNRFPLVAENLVVDTPVMEIESFSNDNQNAGDCKEGTMFNGELGMCTPILNSKHKGPAPFIPALNLVRDDFNPRPLELKSFDDSVNTGDDCKDDEIYMMELDICVPKINSRRDRPVSRQLQSASLIKSGNTNKGGIIPPQSVPSKCKYDEMYVSEIGVCLKRKDLGLPPRNHKKPQSDSLIRVTPAPVQKVPKVATHDEVRCKAGQEIYNPSLNMCVPFTAGHHVERPPPSSSLVKEPEALEIQAFKESVSFSDCLSQGKFYIAELDICA